MNFDLSRWGWGFAIGLTGATAVYGLGTLFGAPSLPLWMLTFVAFILASVVLWGGMIRPRYKNKDDDAEKQDGWQTRHYELQKTKEADMPEDTTEREAPASSSPEKEVGTEANTDAVKEDKAVDELPQSPSESGVGDVSVINRLGEGDTLYVIEIYNNPDCAETTRRNFLTDFIRGLLEKKELSWLEELYNMSEDDSVLEPFASPIVLEVLQAKWRELDIEAFIEHAAVSAQRPRLHTELGKMLRERNGDLPLDLIFKLANGTADPRFHTEYVVPMVTARKKDIPTDVLARLSDTPVYSADLAVEFLSDSRPIEEYWDVTLRVAEKYWGTEDVRELYLKNLEGRIEPEMLARSWGTIEEIGLRTDLAGQIWQDYVESGDESMVQFVAVFGEIREQENNSELKAKLRDKERSVWSKKTEEVSGVPEDAKEDASEESDTEKVSDAPNDEGSDTPSVDEESAQDEKTDATDVPEHDQPADENEDTSSQPPSRKVTRMSPS